MATASTDPAFTELPTAKKGGAEYFWLWVLCLLGLDYFSTLAYHPSIKYHATQRLRSLATEAVVLVTLFGALPVYCNLARRSPGGQGSLGIVVNSNLAFSECNQVFQGERMTAALLDRLTHRCHVFEMNGESFRFRESMKTEKGRKAEPEKS